MAHNADPPFSIRLSARISEHTASDGMEGSCTGGKSSAEFAVCPPALPLANLPPESRPEPPLEPFGNGETMTRLYVRSRLRHDRCGRPWTGTIRLANTCTTQEDAMLFSATHPC